MTLADELRRRMDEKGLTQKGLALAAGVNETYVRDILKGRSQNPTASRLALLAGVLDCSVDDLRGSNPAGSRSQVAKSRDEIEWLGLWRDMDEELRIAAINLLRAMLAKREAAITERDDITHDKPPADNRSR